MPRLALPVLLVLIVLSVSVFHASLVAAGGALAAQDATPIAPAPPIEILVTTFPADSIPTVSSPSFLIWYATIDPDTEVAIPPELTACCPGPQIEHVLAGELTLRVEGPLQVLRASTRGTPKPAEVVAPESAVVLRPGDTAVYNLEHPVTYHNAGTEPVHLVAGGFFAGSPRPHRPTMPSPASKSATRLPSCHRVLRRQSCNGRRWRRKASSQLPRPERCRW